MKLKGNLVLVAVLVVSCAIYALAHSRVESNRADYGLRLHAAAVPLPPEILKALSGEFKGMVANYLLLEAASFIGSAQEPTPDDWNAVARLLDQSSVLDPYFKQTYRLTQSTLPWAKNQLDTAITILDRSRKHLHWDWEPGFYLGFDYYFFLNDNLTASKILMEASEIPGASLTLATLASRLASRSGQTSAAIDFLAAIYQKTDDEETKELLRVRILALQGVETLNRAISLFQKKIGRLPNGLDEIVDSRILSDLPTNPYKRPYSYKNGRVDF